MRRGVQVQSGRVLYGHRVWGSSGLGALVPEKSLERLARRFKHLLSGKLCQHVAKVPPRLHGQHWRVGCVLGHGVAGSDRRGGHANRRFLDPQLDRLHWRWPSAPVHCFVLNNLIHRVELLHVLRCSVAKTVRGRRGPLAYVV